MRKVERNEKPQKFLSPSNVQEDESESKKLKIHPLSNCLKNEWGGKIGCSEGLGY
jgi:hypothetical protein